MIGNPKPVLSSSRKRSIFKDLFSTIRVVLMKKKSRFIEKSERQTWQGRYAVDTMDTGKQKSCTLITSNTSNEASFRGSAICASVRGC